MKTQNKDTRFSKKSALAPGLPEWGVSHISQQRLGLFLKDAPSLLEQNTALGPAPTLGQSREQILADGVDSEWTKTFDFKMDH